MRLEVRNASVYYGANEVFAGLNADFPSLTISALVGPSGSGKSTLLGAMAGFVPLKTGTIAFIDSEGVTSGPDPARVAWVPQASNAMPARNVIDNVMVGSLANGISLDEAREIASECLAKVDIGHLACRRVSQISGGERQRLGFARALASQRPIIFADEPSANLDTANTRMLASILMQLRQTTTIVVATHDPLLEDAAEVSIHIRDEVHHAVR